MKASRIGVLLLNFGGPETLDDVKPFLYNLFSYREVIDLPPLIRKPLAWLIATLRHKTSRRYYEKIGGGSPLRQITVAQGEALKTQLEEEGYDVGIYIGMQCWHPTIPEAVEQMIYDGLTRVVVLPLFPQFSMTTTGACLARLNAILEERPESQEIERQLIAHWYDHPLYIQALAEMIQVALENFASLDAEKAHVLFSAHSIPQKCIDRGDPYLEQTRQTVELIMDRLGRRHPYHLAFQSRLGPAQWLQPYTDKLIEQLGREGVHHVLAVPISFVSEHIETLYEIDMHYQDVASVAGISDFRRVPTPNTHPTFIRALARLVQDQLAAFDLTSASPSRVS